MPDTSWVLQWLGIMAILLGGGGFFVWLVGQESRHPRIDDDDLLHPWE